MPDDLAKEIKARSPRNTRLWKGRDWNSQNSPITHVTTAEGIVFKMTPEEVWEAVLSNGGILKAEPDEGLGESRVRVEVEPNRRLE